jgi:hypothetical protein
MLVLSLSAAAENPKATSIGSFFFFSFANERCALRLSHEMLRVHEAKAKSLYIQK